MGRHWVPVVALGLAFSCSNPDDAVIPAGVVPADTMVVMLSELHLIEGARSGKQIMGDSLSIDEYYDALYLRHGVEAERFKTSFAWYSRHPERLEALYEEVIVRLSAGDVPSTPNRSSESTSLDTVRVRSTPVREEP